MVRHEAQSMRILMIEASGRGFLSHYSHALCLGLTESGNDVELVTGHRDEFAQWCLPIRKTTLLAAGIRSWWQLYRETRRFDPDVVHFQWIDNPLTAAVFVLWLRHRDVKIVYTPHNILPHRGRWRSLPAFRLLYHLVDRIIARDRHIAWVLEEILGFRREKTAFLPGSPNLMAHPLAPERLPAELAPKEDGELRLLYFGHGSARKGLPQLFSALDDGRWPERAHLVIAGEGVLAGIDQHTMDRLRHSFRVTVLDRYIPADEVAGMFKSADLLIMPYVKICKSPLLDLAAVFHLPVLRSDRVTGSWFREGISGTTVTHNDIAALRAALAGLMWAPEQLVRMREALAHEESAVAAIRRLSEQHTSIYHQVCYDSSPQQSLPIAKTKSIHP